MDIKSSAVSKGRFFSRYSVLIRYVILVIALLISVLISIVVGQVDLFPLDETTRWLFIEFRVPRVLFAAVNGGILALAGVLYQISLRNPMADGFTTGAASSAAFGGCLALVLWGNPILVSIVAVITALLGIFLVRWVAKRSGGFNPVTVILAGIALSVIAGSGVSFLKYFFEESVSTMVFWLMGGLGGFSWLKVGMLTVILMLSLATLLIKRREISLLFLDDKSAATSGVNVDLLRELIFLLTTALVAISVSFCGVIGFLGLMIPHAVRSFFGHDIKTQLICSTLCGGTALTLFDLLSRVVLSGGGELPVGIITSLLGGVFFCIVLARSGGKVWRG